MLAGFLESARERVLKDTDRTTDERARGSSRSGARAQMELLLDELIEDLRRGQHVVRPQRTPAFAVGEGERRDRERLRRAVVAEVERLRPEVSLTELMIVSDWSGAVERDALREDNRRFTPLVDAVDDSVVLFSPDGRIVYVNRSVRERLERATGRTLNDILGKTVREVGRPAEGMRRVEEMIARAGRGETVAADVRAAEPVGERWREGRFTPVYEAGGKVVAVVLVARDVHERKLAQRRLELLSKVSMLVGLPHDDLLASIARLSIPDLGDWCAVDAVDGEHVRSTFFAQRDSAQPTLRNELLRSTLPAWTVPSEWRHELLAGRAVLVRNIDAVLRGRVLDHEVSQRFASPAVRS
ncbi:MAG: Phytochrome, two-component sensor histidine kinase, partial [bacterium]|nr:Phytochrome, two-component sensor histidine kinase [bacterium]